MVGNDERKGLEDLTKEVGCVCEVKERCVRRWNYKKRLEMRLV
jgi:hypothetical protein